MRKINQILFNTIIFTFPLFMLISMVRADDIDYSSITTWFGCIALLIVSISILAHGIKLAINNDLKEMMIDTYTVMDKALKAIYILSPGLLYLSNCLIFFGLANIFAIIAITYLQLLDLAKDAISTNVTSILHYSIGTIAVAIVIMATCYIVKSFHNQKDA